jgi:hypothetical protein
MGFYDGHLLPLAVSLTAHMRINGWQRIGIVASVIYAGVVYNRTVDKAEMRYAKVRVDEEMRCEEEHSRKGESFDQYFPTCDALGKTNGGMERSLRDIRESEEEAWTAALLPIPFAWGLVYFALFVVRWIKRGFVRR